MTPIRRGASYAVIAAALIAPAEGLWLRAKVDRIGTGQPPTVCYGMTSADRPVHVGDTYTKDECMGFLIQDIPKYKKPLEKCVHVELSDHEWAALASASYNAGPGAVCKSPMVRNFNAEKHGDACQSFVGWYERAGGKYVPGLHNRRLKERAVCATKDTK